MIELSYFVFFLYLMVFIFSVLVSGIMTTKYFKEKIKYELLKRSIKGYDKLVNLVTKKK